MTDKKQDYHKEKERRYHELRKEFKKFEKQEEEEDGGGFQF